MTIYIYIYDYTCDISNDLKNAIECHKVPGSLICSRGIGVGQVVTQVKQSTHLMRIMKG